MPLPGNGTPAGSVPLDAIDASEIADLLAGAAGIAAALAGDPGAEAACAEHAPGWQDLTDLHFSLALAAAGLDEAIGEHTGIAYQ